MEDQRTHFVIPNGRADSWAISTYLAKRLNAAYGC